MHPTRRKRTFNRLCSTFSLSRFGMLALIAALIMGLVMPSALLAKDNGQRQPTEPAAMREALAKARPKIVGGSPVAAGEAKFAVFVFALVDPNTGSGFQCGGSLISSRFVLTAAHCVEDENGVQFDPAQFILVIGDANIEEIENDDSLFGVVDVSQHPEWNPLAFANDAAVLELDRSVSSSLATPIELVAKGNTSLDQAGQEVSVVGWGRTSGNGETSDQLLKANLKVVSDATCDSTFGDIDDASVICASAANQTSCQGDSGGPLFATATESSAYGKANRAKAHKQKDIKAEKKKHKKHKKHKKEKKGGGGGTTPQTTAIQIGVVSFGPVGCGVGKPAGYAQVSSSEIHDFIDGVIN